MRCASLSPPANLSLAGGPLIPEARAAGRVAAHGGRAAAAIAGDGIGRRARKELTLVDTAYPGTQVPVRLHGSGTEVTDFVVPDVDVATSERPGGRLRGARPILWSAPSARQRTR